MKVYKLTDAQRLAYNNTQWGKGVTHTANGEGKLCGPGWLHHYSDLFLAVLLNPVHTNISGSLRLWEAEAWLSGEDRSSDKARTARATVVAEWATLVSHTAEVAWVTVAAVTAATTKHINLPKIAHEVVCGEPE